MCIYISQLVMFFMKDTKEKVPYVYINIWTEIFIYIYIYMDMDMDIYIYIYIYISYLLVGEPLEGELRGEDGPQRGLVHPHEELPGVVRAAGEGPLDPGVDDDLQLLVALRGPLLPHLARDEVAAVPREHGHHEDARGDLRGGGLDAELVADVEHLHNDNNNSNNNNTNNDNQTNNTITTICNSKHTNSRLSEHLQELRHGVHHLALLVL